MLERLITDVVEKLGYKLYDLELPKGPRGYLRVYIDHDVGVDVEDCAYVSAELGLAGLDALIDYAYTLEVSSPGAFRPLRTRYHYERAVGKRVRVETKHQYSRPVIGTLLRIDDEYLHVADDANLDGTTINLKTIRSANLEPELNFGGKVWREEAHADN